MIKLSIKKIYQLISTVNDLQGTLINVKSIDEKINDIYIDSRKISPFSNISKILFIAIKGKNYDSHKFIYDLYKKGIRNFVIERDIELDKISDANILKVHSSIKALQIIAKYIRDNFKGELIAITGSNGKTMVKEYLFQLLSPDFSIIRSPKSYNSQIGVPLSLLKLKNTYNIAIIEAGISLPGEMEKLERIISPDIGIFTNIGQAHSANFSSLKEKAQEKSKLFQKCKYVIYRSDYNEINFALKKILTDKKLISWSTKNKTADFFIEQCCSSENSKKCQKIKIYYSKKVQNFILPFTDAASFENIVHCIVFLIIKKIKIKTIQNRLKFLLPVSMRLEVLEGKNNNLIINDSYNSDINAIKIAIDFLFNKAGNKKKSIILSDILEHNNKKKLYKELSKLINSYDIYNFFGIGKDIIQYKKFFLKNSLFFDDISSFLNYYKNNPLKNNAILVKGARTFKFEKIVSELQKKNHTTVLEINLNSLSNNINIFRSFLNKNTKIMAMVKAFSYGTGARVIADFLKNKGVDYLGVAYVDEGIFLREEGIDLPIMVMNPEIEFLKSLIKYKLEPEIYSFNILDTFIKSIIQNISSVKIPFPIHIKVDTGMHRLGFMEKDINKLISILLKYKKIIKVKSVFSHLSAAESEELSAFTIKQFKLFEKIKNKFAKKFSNKIEFHILNSSGIIKYPEYQYNMVRLGIGMYGILPENIKKILTNKLETVCTFKSKISQIKIVPKGDYIGYNCNVMLKKDKKIAIIPVGYADGFKRILGNGNWKVLINGKLFPTIGNICMDMTMIDITGAQVEEGDEVVIFGTKVPISKMALKANTIPYEILTSISPRVKRIYIEE